MKKHKCIKEIKTDTKYIHICSYCDDAKEAREYYDSLGYTISDGICKDCVKRIDAE